MQLVAKFGPNLGPEHMAGFKDIDGFVCAIILYIVLWTGAIEVYKLVITMILLMLDIHVCRGILGKSPSHFGCVVNAFSMTTSYFVG